MSDFFDLRTSLVGGLNNTVGNLTEVNQLRSNSVSENNNWKRTSLKKVEKSNYSERLSG